MGTIFMHIFLWKEWKKFKNSFASDVVVGEEAIAIDECIKSEQQRQVELSKHVSSILYRFSFESLNALPF